MKTKRYVTIIMMFSIMLLITMSVKASTLVIKEPIRFGWVRQEFTLEENTTNRHIIEMQEAGELTVLLGVYSGVNYWRLYDQNMVLLYENYLWGSADSSRSDLIRIDLMPGIYYLHYECTNAAGDYYVMAKMKSAENNETEPNNTKYQAMMLGDKAEVNGFLTTELGVENGKKSAMSDTTDYYSFELTNAQQLKIYFRQRKGGATLQILNSKMKTVRELKASMDNTNINTHLPAGKYFICITSGEANDEGGGAGDYKLHMEKSVSAPVVGKVYSDQKTHMRYKITSFNEKEVKASIVGATFDSIEKLTIQDSIDIGGAEVKVTAISKNAFTDCYRLKIVEIGDNITSIGTSAFHGCTALEMVKGGKDITKIGANAFYGCTALKQMGDIRNRVTLYSAKTIGKKAFWGCTSVKRVAVPSHNLERIHPSAFGKCSGLKVATIASKKLKAIGLNAFNGCTQLQRVTMKTKELNTVGKFAFRGVKEQCVIKVPAKKLKEYKKFFGQKRMGSLLQVKKIR